MECVRKLCDAIDRDYDDRISCEEIRLYIEEKELPFEDDIAERMFEEAAQGRGYINAAQMQAPLSHEEVAATVRGRHRWNPKIKEWEIYYRPFRNYWIVLLLTVNKRIFAMPVPRVIPTKITAQYEQEEDYQRAVQAGLQVSLQQSAAMSSMPNTMNRSMKTGIDGRYMSIKDIKQPIFQRDLTKNEAEIRPDKGSTIKIAPRKQKHVEINPYEKQISNRMMPSLETGNEYPRVTFAAQQVFDEVCSLSTKVPTWNTPAQNPIHTFVPEAEQSYKMISEERE